MKKILIVTLLVLIVSAMLVSACSKTSSTSTAAVPTTTTVAPTTTGVVPTASATSTETPKYGGILKIIQGPPSGNFGCTYEPTMGGDYLAAAPAIETLLMIDTKTGEPIPWLASGWTVAPDKSSLTLTLQKNVKFSDGTPFDADAVKYVLDQYRAGTGTELKNVTSIDVIDQYTVRENLSSWTSFTISCLAVGPGRMASPTVMKAHDDKYLYNHPVGTGPFILDSYDTTTMKFSKNPNYWQAGKPYLDGIEWEFDSDQTTGLMSFQNGEAQMNLNISNITVDQVNAMKAKGYLFTQVAGAVMYMCPDSASSDSPWSNLKVRQAACYAMQQSQIPTIKGYGVLAATQLAYPGQPGYNPDVVGYPYDLAKAKQLMADAGYSNGFDTTIYGIEMDNTLYTAIQSWWAAIGIRAKIQNVSWAQDGQMMTQGWDNGAAFYYMETVPGVDPTQCFNTFFSPTGSLSPTSKSVAYPADYVADLTKATTEPDDNVRNSLLQDMEKIIVNDACLFVPMHVVITPAVQNGSVHDSFLYEGSASQWNPESAWLSQ